MHMTGPSLPLVLTGLLFLRRNVLPFARPSSPPSFTPPLHLSPLPNRIPLTSFPHFLPPSFSSPSSPTILPCPLSPSLPLASPPSALFPLPFPRTASPPLFPSPSLLPLMPICPTTHLPFSVLPSLLADLSPLPPSSLRSLFHPPSLPFPPSSPLPRFPFLPSSLLPAFPSPYPLPTLLLSSFSPLPLFPRSPSPSLPSFPFSLPPHLPSSFLPHLPSFLSPLLPPLPPPSSLPFPPISFSLPSHPFLPTSFFPLSTLSLFISSFTCPFSLISDPSLRTANQPAATASEAQRNGRRSGAGKSAAKNLGEVVPPPKPEREEVLPALSPAIAPQGLKLDVGTQLDSASITSLPLSLSLGFLASSARPLPPFLYAAIVSPSLFHFLDI
ncbi:hypothetical protein C7M84_015924 [Penaeus vannamei]|uniref:Uncharacterized protein n=1 Tax=Penaeus vannamei TaxID=6689 RepID=A0A3R7SLN2_PENVA|nr:hypothetical protein C7M84_015924 [Penaeus vannamei]